MGASFATNIGENHSFENNEQVFIQKTSQIDDTSKVNNEFSNDLMSTNNSLKKTNTSSIDIMKKGINQPNQESTGLGMIKKIYVDQKFNNSKQLGTRENPYYTLDLALNSTLNKYNNIIYLNEGTYKLSNTHNILKNISLIGSNRGKTIINCNSKQGFRVYKGSILTFENLTVTNANYSQGGAVLLSSNSKLIINNCTFKKNKGNNGAVLFGSGANISANITNSSFESNTAVKFGAALQLGGYDSIYNVINCTFIKNILTDTNYSHSTGGAAIYASAYASVNVDNSVFKNNEAIWGNAILNGNHATLRVYNSKFTSNIAVKNIEGSNRTKGGAIAVGSGYAEINNCYFENNMADIGGAISINSGEKALITSCLFQKNIAYYEAGAINNYGLLTLKNTSFIKNSAERFGGALLDKGVNNILIDKCTFKDNRVSTCKNVSGVTPKGGAIYIVSGVPQFTIKNTVFDHNSAYYGGAIFSYSNVQWITIKNSKFNNNTACYAGALYISGETTIDIDKCTFTYNRALRKGGSIVITNMVQGNFVNTKFNYNVANQSNDGYGGVIYLDSYSRLGFNYCHFASNYANIKGGVIYSSSVVNIRIVFSNMTKNTATIGSTIYLNNSKNYKKYKSQIILDGSSFIANQGKYVMYSSEEYNSTYNYNLIRTSWWGTNNVPGNMTYNFKLLNYHLLTVALNDIALNTNWIKDEINIVVNRTKNADKNLIITINTIKENNAIRYTDAFILPRKVSLRENNQKVVTKDFYVYYHLDMSLDNIIVKLDYQRITIKIVD